MIVVARPAARRDRRPRRRHEALPARLPRARRDLDRGAVPGWRGAMGRSRWCCSCCPRSASSARNVFYDALIVSVASEDRYDVVSALGYALGYLGGGLLFAVNVAMTLWPARFGLADAEQAVRLSFLLMAVVVGGVLDPAVPVRAGTRRCGRDAAGARDSRRALRQLRRDLPRDPQAADGWSCSCSPTGCTSTASTPSSGWRSTTAWRWASRRNGLILALLITQFVGFPAAHRLRPHRRPPGRQDAAS